MPNNLKNIEKINISLKDFEEAIAHLKNRRGSNLHFAVANLAIDLNRELRKLQSSPGDLVLVSLAVRNIFEIYLISKHICSNEKALFSWYGQAHKDSKEINDAVITLAKKKGLDTSEIEALQKFEDESLKESPFESASSFKIKSLAETYGHLDDYQFIYKLCSKLVHPSSMKIWSFEALTENSNYLNIILHTGVYFTQEFGILLRSVIYESA